MSRSSSSLAPSSTVSESFKEAPLSHGASGGSGLFQASGDGEYEVSKERVPTLNPFAQEFVPFPSPSASEHRGTINNTDSGALFRRKGRHEAYYGESVTAASTGYGKGSNGASSKPFGSLGRNGFSRSWQSSGTAGTIPPGGRKGQALRADHLLKFQYDPIPRPSPRSQPPRRQKRTQPYNKELFLQANFRFLVSDLGDYVLNASDPDKMLQWEDVAAVNVTAPVPVQCPICLDTPPLCPQITSCGHIFCFPCILHYLMLGDQRVKKCPLCFAMISCKDLRTVSITSVHQYRPGDRLRFNLVTRAKNSITPFEKSKGSLGALAYSEDGHFHPYSKFTLTSEAEFITDRAVADLTAWAAQAEVVRGEDLDVVPYIYEAVEQLQQRKQTWTEHRTLGFLSSSPPVRQRIVSQPKAGFTKSPGDILAQSLKGVDGVVSGSHALRKRQQVGDDGMDIVAQTEAAMAKLKEKSGWVYESAFADDEDGGKSEESNSDTKGKAALDHDEFVNMEKEVGFMDPSSDWEELPPEAPETKQPFVLVDGERKEQDVKKDQEESDSYTFYQSADGQFLILHPLNMKCLLQHYGDYDALPSSLEADVVELESVTQTEATRKRYRYLSHLPLTANFQLCEMDLSEMLPSEAFTPFLEEIRIRQQKRRRRLQEEKLEKVKEERMAAAAAASRPKPPSLGDFGAYMASLQVDEVPTSSDFGIEESTVVVASPSSDSRVLFSNVAKMGFASGYDAPQLNPAVAVSSTPWGPSASSRGNPSIASRGESGSQGSSSLSFADIIQAQAPVKAADVEEGVATGVKSGRKNKKGSMVLLSTAGGRRY